MRIIVDETNDALYIRLNESLILESEEVQPGVILDFDDQKKVVGIEILGLKSRVPKEQLQRLQFETA